MLAKANEWIEGEVKAHSREWYNFHHLCDWLSEVDYHLIADADA